jgi:hypothetical protein
VTARVPLWRIHADLWTARLLLAVAPSAASQLGAEDHRFLAVRHAQLATRWRHLGWIARARAHEEKAAWHWRAAGADEPPPAVAMGMPRPRPALAIDARGRSLTTRATVVAFPGPRSPR